jgi:2',3'-cyclic-nucleotide 2'-phosphodiesterase
MRILYVGDITGKLGRATAKKVLPDLIKAEKVDFVIAQGENVSHGKGLSVKHAQELMNEGVDFFTGGNHTLSRPEIFDLPNVIRPANLKEAPGVGHKLVDTPFGKLLIVSLQGQIVGMDSSKALNNPLEVVNKIIEDHKSNPKVGIIVNFHGDYSSEKVVIGQYLDGKVTAVIGDHWHVPTADAQVQPKGTAHITDVGMVGALDSSLGVQTDIIVKRWLTQEPSRNEMEDSGRAQFNAVLIDIDTKSGKAKQIQQIRQIF